MVKIKEDSSNKGPREIVDVSRQAGGILGAIAPGQLPRDEKQISNVKRRTQQGMMDSVADELFVCNAMWPRSQALPLYFIRAILFTRNYCGRRTEKGGENLGGLITCGHWCHASMVSTLLAGRALTLHWNSILVRLRHRLWLRPSHS